MAEYIIQSETLTNIAEPIRSLVSGEGELTPEQMVEQLDTANSIVVAQAELIEQIKTALGGKSVDNGLDTSDATATTDDIVDGKTAYVNGEKVVGTMRRAAYEPAFSIEYNELDDTINLNIKPETNAYLLKNGYNSVYAESIDFGNATKADVASGKTFTAQGGLKMVGTKVDLDTSDATATATDIADGKTAYVNGVKVTGNAIFSSDSSSPTIVTEKDVNFIDYDGTILYSYTIEEAQALTELPPLPNHDGLVCQGWNYDLATIKEYNRDVTVGAMYITDDGKTRIYISLQDGRTSPMLGCCPKGTVTVDWGDGSTPDTLTGTSTSTVKWTSNHQYANVGDYVITLTIDGAMGFYGEDSSNAYSGILRFSSSADSRNIVYQNSIIKVEIGNGITSIGQSAFYNCYSLTSISIPDSVTNIEGSAFQNCYSLASISIPYDAAVLGISAFRACYSLVSVSIPHNVSEIADYAFYNCYSLTNISIPDDVTDIRSNVFYNCYSLIRVSIPDSVASIGNYAFNNCRSLISISIPDGVESILANTFYNCHSLTRFLIPDNVTSIGNYAFYNCYGVVYYDFTHHTTVPSLAHTYAFSGISADCEIRVPAALVDEWKATTNWSTYADYIVGV